jgi:hypothetical protein
MNIMQHCKEFGFCSDPLSRLLTILKSTGEEGEEEEEGFGERRL